MQIYLPIAELPVNMFLILVMGLAVGFISGMFGIGGGFLMTPLLIFIGISPAVARRLGDLPGVARVLAATQFEAPHARRAFPCFDEPEFKAIFVVTLVVADGLLAISNGPEVAPHSTMAPQTSGSITGESPSAPASRKSARAECTR